MPEVVILDDRGLTQPLDELEHELEMDLNRAKLLGDIFDCLKRADTAELELEYLCLAHAEHEQLHNEAIVKAVKTLGALLLDKLHAYGLYRRGETPYVLLRTRLGGMELLRLDVYRDRLKQEIADPGVKKKPRPTPEQAKAAQELLANIQSAILECWHNSGYKAPEKST